MDPDLLRQLADQKDWTMILAVAVFVLCCYILGRDELDRRLAPKKPVVEFCKLHSRPVTECRNQHKLGGPDAP